MSRSGPGNWGGKEGGGGGFHGNGISKPVVDVASPKARSEQAEGGHERAAVCAEELIDVRSTQLEDAVLMPAMKSAMTRTSAERFPSEPVTRARYSPSLPYFINSAETVEPGYFASKATEIFGGPRRAVLFNFFVGGT